MFQRIQVGIALILVPLAGIYFYMESNNITFSNIFETDIDIMQIGEIPIHVEIADSDEERTNGLSGRGQLKDRQGILFVFPEPGNYSFWMKDMKFPIDIIWINDDLMVVGVDRDVAPDTYPHRFFPSEPVRYVVETNAGYTDTFGIGVGESVRLPLSLKKFSE